MKLLNTALPTTLFCLASLFGISAGATTIDFTDDQWNTVQGVSNVSQSGVTLASTGGTMTFNSGSESNGCVSASAGLTCDGDGIGIGNDEITGNRSQTLTITFDSLVNIIQVELLDLFKNEGDEITPHEVAIINGTSFTNPTSTTGGHLATGFQANGITVLTFTAGADAWSDYALAKITYSSVTEPGSIALLALGLIGLGVARRRSRS